VHPFEHAPGVLQFFVGVVAAVLAGFGMAIMRDLGVTLRTRGAGIVDFELAGSAKRLNEIRCSWGAEGQTAAVQSLLVDTVLFVPGYAVLTAIIAAGCAQEVGFRTASALADVTRVAAWLALLAGSLDLAENAALGLVLHGHVRVPGRIAQWCASVKFVAIGVAAAWLVFFVVPVVAAPTVVAHERYDAGRQSSWLTPDASSSRSRDQTCWWVPRRPSAPDGATPRTKSGAAPGAMRWNWQARSRDGAYRPFVSMCSRVTPGHEPTSTSTSRRAAHRKRSVGSGSTT
jgi:hypothetical protein